MPFSLILASKMVPKTTPESSSRRLQEPLGTEVRFTRQLKRHFASFWPPTWAQHSSNTVTFGTTIVVADEDTDEESTYTVVGPYEADISKGLISTSSPIAKALIGKKVGDTAEVNTPRGSKSYEILNITIS